ncbi:MAG: DNA cytosine methyltransferase [Candidatus Omnitrophota bacterium]
MKSGKKSKSIPSKLKVVDLFSGCGGKTKGFENAGYNLIGAFDNWRPAVDVYRANFKGHEIHEVDLSKTDECIKIIKKLKPDIIIGGPPCQDFSHAGKRNEDLGRGDLTVSFAKIVSSVKPQWFVMENVDRILSSRKIRIVYEKLKKAGYGLTCTILDASFCGVPQKRKRFFMIGEKGGVDNQLIPYLEKDLSASPLTVRQYFKDALDVDYYYRHPRNYNRRGIYSVDEPSATIRGVNRPVPKGYPGHSADPVPMTSTMRSLTTKERSLIQTFPEDFVFQGSKSNIEQMIGNAVPVKLAEYIARCIKDYVSDRKKGKILKCRNNRLPLLLVDSAVTKSSSPVQREFDYAMA